MKMIIRQQLFREFRKYVNISLSPGGKIHLVAER